MKSSYASPPDPRITRQQAAQELLRRRGLLESTYSEFAQALIKFGRGEIYPDEILSLCESLLDLRLPTQGVCPKHQAPGQYLLDALSSPGEDSISWACRGGGKTLVGGLLTTIESAAYPGCKARILGGSEDQSLGFYEHTKNFIYQGDLSALIEGEPLTTRVNFKNGSRIKVLTASEKSVRGPHVPRLIMDEVDLFEPRLYRAAIPMVTSTSTIQGCTRIYSTMNEAGGLMSQLVDESIDEGRRLYTWCLWDVIERCEGRDCGPCVLWEDCQGKALEGTGFFKIADAIRIRTTPGFSRDDWESQILCLKPGSKFLIWPQYDEQVHLYYPPADYDPAEFRQRFKRVLAGVDWGYTNPAAIIVVGEDAQGILWVVEEFYESLLLASELGDVARRLWEKWRIERFYPDPEDPDAIETWRRMKLPVARANNNVDKGINLVAARFQLLPPHRRPIIQILSTLVNLRREIKGYRYRGDEVRGSNLRGDEAREDIIKKNDHAVSALRYVLVAFDAPSGWASR